MTGKDMLYLDAGADKQVPGVVLVDASGVALSAAATGVTTSQVNSAAATTTLLAANDARRGVTIANTDPNTLRVKLGPNASAADWSVPIMSGQVWEMPQPIYRGVITGIWDADGSGVAAISESV